MSRGRRHTTPSRNGEVPVPSEMTLRKDSRQGSLLPSWKLSFDSRSSINTTAYIGYFHPVTRENILHQRLLDGAVLTLPTPLRFSQSECSLSSARFHLSHLWDIVGGSTMPDPTIKGIPCGPRRLSALIAIAHVRGNTPHTIGRKVKELARAACPKTYSTI